MIKQHVPRKQVPFSEQVGHSCIVPRQFIDVSDLRTLRNGDVSVHYNSPSEIIAHSRYKIEWCANCRAGNCGKCSGRRTRKYERGYAPCECAVHGHGRKDEDNYAK